LEHYVPWQESVKTLNANGSKIEGVIFPAMDQKGWQCQCVEGSDMCLHHGEGYLVDLWMWLQALLEVFSVTLLALLLVIAHLMVHWFLQRLDTPERVVL
jgi:hypothetical protein